MGVGFSITRGVRLSSSHFYSRAIKEKVRNFAPGDLIITNKRVIFTGEEDTFEFKINQISMIKRVTYEDIIIQACKSSRNFTFDNPCISEFVKNVILATADGIRNGEDDINDYLKRPTPEQKRIMDLVEIECDNVIFWAKLRSKCSPRTIFIVIAIIVIAYFYFRLKM